MKSELLSRYYEAIGLKEEKSRISEEEKSGDTNIFTLSINN